MDTYTQNYPSRRTYEKYDSEHFLLYVNEAAVEYTPQAARLDGGNDDNDGEAPAPAPVPGYSYTGNMPDGGTLVSAKNAEYGAFVAGLIALRYTDDDVQAVQSNQLAALADKNNAKASQWKQEFNDYQAYRATCKAQAKAALGIE
jgi:hypothetical protein